MATASTEARSATGLVEEVDINFTKKLPKIEVSI